MEQKIDFPPIYSNIIHNIEKNPEELPVSQKRNLLRRIASIDSNGSEMIYVLIRCYWEDNEKVSTNVPYDGQFLQGGDIQFDLNKLPNRLQYILYRFTEMHQKKLKEDREKTAAMSQVNRSEENG